MGRSTEATTAMLVTGFYVAGIGFALGIFTRSFFDIGLPEIAFVLLLSFAVGVLWRKNPNSPQTVLGAPQLLLVSIFLFLFALGALRLEWASWSEINPAYESRVDSEITLTGTIIREPDERESTTHLYVDTDLPAAPDESQVEEETVLVIASRYGEFAYGDVVTVEGVVRKPESFETDLGRTFNYPGYLLARDVSYLVSFAEVTLTDRGQGNPVITSLLSFKRAFMQKIEELLPEPQVGLGEGLLLGVKRALGEDLERVFRETGIIHIVVLSGYNVMLVVIFVTFLLGVFIPKRLQLPFGLTAIAAFALMVGLSATVVRASVMAGLYLLARSLNRTYLVIRALMLAGVVMLLINPYLLAFDTGFQLSFVATLGLILVGPHIEARLQRIPNKFIKAREFLTATLATQIFVLPILLYQIGEFSVVSVIVNVLVLPMVPAAMLLTFITGMVSFISTPLASILSITTYTSLTYIILVAEWFAALPFASYVVPAFPFWLVILAYALLGYGLFRLQNYERETNDSLAGWVIEEEEIVRQRLTTKDASTPIFFRTE